MRQTECALLIGLVMTSAGPSYSSQTNDPWNDFNRLASRECREKHLDYQTMAGFGDLFDKYDHSLSPIDRKKIDMIASGIKRNLCRESIGMGCGDTAYLSAVEQVGKLHDLIRQTCKTAAKCKALYDCK